MASKSNNRNKSRRESYEIAKEEIHKLSLEQLLKIKFEQMLDTDLTRFSLGVYKEILNLVTKVLLELSLKKCSWNITKTSKFLGITRNTVMKKIHDLKINNNS